MENMRPFQIGLLIGFALIALVSIIIIASYQGISGGATSAYGSRVLIWGTFSESAFSSVLYDLSRQDKGLQVVQYVQKNRNTFESELVNAIAEGRSPDAIILDSEYLLTLRTKIQPISYNSFPQRTLKDNYLDGFEIFALSDGLYSIPFAVDPVIMYWNRSILSSGGFSQPPATWESLTNLVENITLRDATRNISQATVAFGEYYNVINSKSLLLTLLLQSGSRMIEEGQSRYTVVINNDANNSSRRPLTSTLQFYVEFSNPASPLYSWNKTFQDDLVTFLGERLALYFGYGSESKRIASQNPNLNFDAVGVPQGAEAITKQTYGKFYGFSILKASPNRQGTYQALLAISGYNSNVAMANNLSLVPAYRAAITAGNSDAVMQTAYSQALIARGWLDPNPSKSSEAFGVTINEILSGRNSVGVATSDLIRRLELAF